jgi:FimV-like protein
VASALVLGSLAVLCTTEALAQAKKGPQSVARPATKPPASQKPTAEVPASYEVVRGDTLFRIAGKVRHPGVTINQIVLGLYRANPDAFLDGNINQLVVGRTLSVPSREAVAAVDPARAAQELKALISKPVVAPAPAPVQPAPPPAREPAAPRPRPEPPPSKPVAPAALLTPQQASARYEEGVAADRKGEHAAALAAFLAAGESGHGLAQKRLGDIYNTGNEVVRRDYETALRWYRKAREQGIEIPRPLTRPPVRPN